MNFLGLFHRNGTSPHSKRKRPRSENRPKRPLRSPPRLEVLEDRTLLTVYTVTLPGDNNSGTGGTPDPKIPDAGDLRYCVTQADKGTGNSIQFGTKVSGQTINLQEALPAISQSMSITNQPGVTGVTVERSPTATSNFGIFTINSKVNVSLGAFTISKGYLDGTPVLDMGAGIYNQGSLTLNGTTVQNNITDDWGGGILNAGSLTLKGATISDNQAKDGGGIYNVGNITTAPNGPVLTVLNNQASASGGGIYNTGSATLTKANFKNNTAQGNDGGGIWNNGSLTIQKSTFTNNQAPAGDGGGIFNSKGVTINQSTFNQNTAGGQGGAIMNNGNGRANGITVNGNAVTGQIKGALSAGGGIYTSVGTGISFQLVNSIVAGNTAPTYPPNTYPNNPDVDGVFTEGSSGGPQGHNFIGNGTGGNFVNGVNGDQVGTATKALNPMLGTLQNNGGGIPTMMPQAGSPVINAGDPTNPPATDERGYNRTVFVGGNPAIDIGAVESAAPTPPLVMSVTGVQNQPAGPTAGGNTVTINGNGFTKATAVYFGSTAATNVTVNSNGTQITATAPAGSAGTVDVTITTANGTSATSSADQYTYDAPPAVSGVSPNSGPTSGGTLVAITGSGFTGATKVYFGSTPATFTFYTDGYITAYSPMGGSGTVDVTVVTPGGTSATGSQDQFTYT